MENKSNPNALDPKPENARCGGPDDSRVAKPNDPSKADDCEKAQPAEHDNVPRSTPVDTRSN